MRAIVFDEPGEPHVLRLDEVEEPVIHDDEALIEVAFAGVNRPDCLQRAGLYPPPAGASPRLGLEVSGVIVALGKQVQGFAIGDRVMALTNGGGYSTLVAVKAGTIVPVPDGLSMSEAAGLPEALLTVWHNLFERGRLKEGERCLIHGGSSGIGSLAIQLAKAKGAWVATTAGQGRKVDFCYALGADLAINYREEDFVELIEMETDNQGVDVILDMVGGDYVERNYRAAAFEGRVISIAFLEGRKAAVDLSLLMRKRLTHSGSMLRSRSDSFKARLTDAAFSAVGGLLSSGEVRPKLYQVFPLEEAARAHDGLEKGEVMGKLILQVRGEVKTLHGEGLE